MRETRIVGIVARAALTAVTLVALSVAGDAAAQRAPGQVGPALGRPLPAPVVPPPFFRRAVNRGTRSPDGRPGPEYRQPWSEYEIDAHLDPGTARLEGSERVRFANLSPDTLRTLVMHLHQNLHRAGTVRNEAQEITGGVDLERVVVDGVRLRPRGLGPGPAYSVSATMLSLRPPEPVAPGDTAEIEVDWALTLPQSGAGRMGWSEREMYFVAYWFPKMAVYDDLLGWDAQPYLGNAEFYDGYGSYDVGITVPVGWTVMATGTLENPQDVWTARTRRRLEAAAAADTIVPVATSEDRRADRVTARSPTGYLRYRFRADTVRDFAFTASDVQRWDATSAEVGDRDGDGRADRVLIHSFWRPDRAPLWEEQALYGKHSVEHHSRYTGFAYPWPHMTSVEGAGIIGGGMEFPMMTVIGPYRGRQPRDLYNVTAHEIAHMWIPMIVGTNEKRYAWIDEGATTFLEDQAKNEYWPGVQGHLDEMERYLRIARAELEEPLMRHGDYYPPGPSYGTASYSKPATLLYTLRGLLGEEVFHRAYRAFIRDWAYRHPTPWDLFNAFEREADRDLDWFWRPFFYETWTLDHAVTGVESDGSGTTIRIEDQGWAILPARLRIETEDAGTLRREVPVSHWLQGERRAEVRIPESAGRVHRVELDPDRLFPDADRADDAWSVDPDRAPSSGPR